MKMPDTIKHVFVVAVALVLTCLSGCAKENSSKKVTQKNLATQLVEASEMHAVIAQSYAFGYREGALRNGDPEKEIDCVMNQVTPELLLPLLADVFNEKCSDDELRQAISFYESETGKTYVRVENMKIRLMFGLSAEEPPEYSVSDEDRIVTFEQTLVGKLMTSQDTSLRDTIKEKIRPQMIAIFDQCKNAR